MAIEQITKRHSLLYTQRIVVGTRGSALAQWQANHVIVALKRIVPDLQIEIRIIKTTGDKDQSRALADLGGQGVFTKEIESALLAHEIDLAVHSLKDLPTELGEGLTIAAITEREDPRDCLISRDRVGLMQLPQGARVGTSSARRSAQVLALRPDVQIVPLRGNVDTRIRKAQTEEYDAVVLAAAGVIRLGRANEITEYFSLDNFLPDPGQGALAIEIRANEPTLAALVSRLDDAPARAAVTAERAFLRALGGGCRMPIGTFAEMCGDQLLLRALIASDDGSNISRGEVRGAPEQADELGTRLAAKLTGARHSSDQDHQQAKSPSADIAGKKSGLDEFHASTVPLQGRKILITRAREQASVLADKIRALGGEPVEFPTIEFEPLRDFTELDNALAQVDEYDWVVFTSANGVNAVSDRLQTLGKAPRVWKAKIAAIGPATASALEAIGLRVDFVPSKFLGEQIAIELPIARGQRALLLRADIASNVLERGLAERGIAVTNVIAYQTVMPSDGRVDLSGIDAVTFTSSSTVRNFVAMRARLAPSPFSDREGENRNGLYVFCIGPVTAVTAREMGLNVDAVAVEHTIDGLVHAILDFYGQAGRR